MRHFYSHIIQIDSLFTELEELNLSAAEKHHLGELIDSTLHHKILDALLSELKDEDKETFLRLVSTSKHDTIMQHLSEKVDDIEEKIKKAAEEIKVEMQKDIKDVKRLKGKA